MKPGRDVESIAWEPHPVVPGVQIKPLVTKRDDGLDVSCLLVRVPVGSEVPEHIHGTQDDIVYPLEGKASMWVDGSDVIALAPGVLVRVPKGTRHRIYDVQENLLFYGVFSPALM